MERVIYSVRTEHVGKAPLLPWYDVIARNMPQIRGRWELGAWGVHTGITGSQKGGLA